MDVDECEQLGREGACGHGDCANVPGSYECRCHRGFAKAGGAGRCEDLDECSEDAGRVVLKHATWILDKIDVR